MLDLDNTDTWLHGAQEGRFFRVITTRTATCRSTCFAGICCWPGSGVRMLLQRWRAIEEMTRIIGQIRQTWPRVRIILRGDSGFANEPLMRWCEEHRVDYVFGLARNSRPEAALANRCRGQAPVPGPGKPARVFRDFRYRTRDSWCRKRRCCVGKAEHTPDGANLALSSPRLKHARMADPRALYEDLHCACGEAENRIGEQFELFRRSCLVRHHDGQPTAHGSRRWPTCWSIRYAVPVCTLLSSSMPRRRFIRLKL